MKKKLTAKTIDALKPRITGRFEVRDVQVTGFLVRVSATGDKVFYFTKRINKKMKRIRIGSYPAISLSEARQQARNILREVELGIYDEAGSEALEEAVPAFGDVVDQFIELYAKPRSKYWNGTLSLLTKFASINGKPIDKIKRTDVVQVLDDIIASGAPVRANRALAAIKKMMNWCVDRGMIDASPISTLKPPTKEIPRDRVLSDFELMDVWYGAESKGYPFAQFIQMLVLTGQRRGEVAGIRWSEIDMENATWTIPANRAKNANLHIVPLAPLLIDILKSVPVFLGSDFVFTTTGYSPISGFGRLKKSLEKSVGQDAEDWRPHDIRRTMSSNMAMLGVQPHIIEAVLNHKSGIVSGVAAVYNRHTYMDEKREALEKWAEFTWTKMVGKSHKAGATKHCRRMAS